MSPDEINKMLGGTSNLQESLSSPIKTNTTQQIQQPTQNPSSPADINKLLGGSTSMNGQNQTDGKSFLQKAGDFFTGSTQELGKNIANSTTAPENTKKYAEAVTLHTDVTNNLLKAIKSKGTNGGDVSHLQTALQQHLQDVPKIEDFVGADTARRLNETMGQNAEEVIGQGLGAGLETLSGGALGGLENKSASIGGKLLKASATGAGYGAVSGASNAMQQEKDLSGVATDTTVGALVGGVIGGATSGIGQAFKGLVDTLPNRLVRNAIPGLDKAGANYALENKSIGTVGKLFKDSADAVVNLNNQIDTVLKHPDLIDEKIDTPKLINNIIYGKFGNSNYTDETLIKTMKSLVPAKAKLIDKIMSGEASLADANEVKKALYQQTKKVFGDTPVLNAKKQLGAGIATSIADTIKAQAPETVPIFDKMSKEINLRDLLLKQFKKQDAQKLIGLYDLGTIGAGHALGGAPGAIVGEVGKKVLNNPATKFAGAKALNTIGKIKGLPTIIKTLNTKI